MSLKVFHVIFITLALLLSAFCAYLAFTDRTARVVGYVSIAAAVALVIYGVWFLRKSKNIIV